MGRQLIEMYALTAMVCVGISPYLMLIIVREHLTEDQFVCALLFLMLAWAPLAGRIGGSLMARLRVCLDKRGA